MNTTQSIEDQTEEYAYFYVIGYKKDPAALQFSPYVTEFCSEPALNLNS